MFLHFCKGCLSPQKVLLLHWKPSQHDWWKPIIGVLHCRTLWWRYKIRCLWRGNMQPTPSIRTFVLNPLLPSTSTPDAVLHLICCTCLALTFASCRREEVHLFFLHKRESAFVLCKMNLLCLSWFSTFMLCVKTLYALL